MALHFRKHSSKFPLTLGLGLLIGLLGCSSPSAPPPTPTTSPEVIRGKQVFSAECARCHATTPDMVIVGPSLAGIADRAGERVEGVDAQSYLLKSILAPESYLVEGYTDLMPADLAKKLTGEEMDAVVAYLMTLKE